MKTNSIFRTFFMAVVLFMGIDSAQADTLLWENQSGSGDQEYIYIGFDKFDGHKGEVLRITYETVAYSWGPDYIIKIGSKDIVCNTVHITVATSNVAERGVYELALDDGFYEKGCDFIQPAFVKIYKIEIVGASSSGSQGDTYYTVSYDSTIAHGTVTADPKSAKAGTTITLTAEPDWDYVFDYYEVKKENGETVTVNGNQFEMPESDVTVNAMFKEREKVSAIIDSNFGYATFCSDKALDFSSATELMAYYAEAVDDGVVMLKPVIGTVAAGTGLVLVGSSDRIPVAESGNVIGRNLLVGVLTEISVKASNCYVLTKDGNDVKFASTSNNSATVPAGHAYLEIPSSTRSYTRLSVSVNGGTTGIEDMLFQNGQREDNVYYNLLGERVTNPTRGIYIVNGKKVFVK